MTDAVSSAPKTRKVLYWGLGIIAGLTTMLLFDHFGIFQYFWISFISIIALSFAVWENRSYHKEIWFWISLFGFTALHLFFVVIVGEHRWLMSIGHGTGQGVAMVAIADGLVITAVIRFPDWITSTMEWFFSDDLRDSAERTAK
jgi:hypothetical protein